MELSEQKCVPCEGGTPPMPEDEAKQHILELNNWTLEDNKIEKSFKFSDFVSDFRSVIFKGNDIEPGIAACITK